MYSDQRRDALHGELPIVNLENRHCYVGTKILLPPNSFPWLSRKGINLAAVRIPAKVAQAQLILVPSTRFTTRAMIYRFERAKRRDAYIFSQDARRFADRSEENFNGAVNIALAI